METRAFASTSSQDLLSYITIDTYYIGCEKSATHLEHLRMPSRKKRQVLMGVSVLKSSIMIFSAHHSRTEACSTKACNEKTAIYVGCTLLRCNLSRSRLEALTAIAYATIPATITPNTSNRNDCPKLYSFKYVDMNVTWWYGRSSVMKETMMP